MRQPSVFASACQCQRARVYLETVKLTVFLLGSNPAREEIIVPHQRVMWSCFSTALLLPGNDSADEHC